MDHLLDSAGSGAAFLDYDRDGILDVYIVNGWRLSGSDVAERGRHALYRGRPGGRFEDVTEEAGTDGGGLWGAGAAAADYDGDGWTDILVTGFGRMILYRNLGDGAFEDAAPRAGLALTGWHTGAAFLDADRDGDLDLYVAAYIDCSLEDVLKARPALDFRGLEKVAVGPFGLKGAKDRYFRQEAGRFVEATAAAGLEDRGEGYGFAVRAADYDGDGDADVYVANDSDANYLYRNDGTGRFEEVAVWSGCALSGAGAAQAGMGVAAGDATDDGLLDLVVTNFAEDYTTLYRGLGGGFFEDASGPSGLAAATFLPMSWGVALADLDNDGDLDLAVANGHIYPQVDRRPQAGHTFAQRCQLLENRDGTFHDVTDRAGPGFELLRSARGLAAGDHDADGDVDLLFTALNEPPALLRNESRTGSWLIVEPEVPAGRGALIGTRVRVTAGGRTMIRDFASGDSYMSTHAPRAHFGLGSAGIADLVEVAWPDGAATIRRGVPARQLLRIRKGN
jgi:hypothetical protein